MAFWPGPAQTHRGDTPAASNGGVRDLSWAVLSFIFRDLCLFCALPEVVLSETGETLLLSTSPSTPARCSTMAAQIEPFQFPNPVPGCDCAICERVGVEDDKVHQPAPIFFQFKIQKVDGWSSRDLSAEELSVMMRCETLLLCGRGSGRERHFMFPFFAWCDLCRWPGILYCWVPSLLSQGRVRG